MKNTISLLLCLILLTGCGQKEQTPELSLNAYLLQSTMSMTDELCELTEAPTLISLYTSDTGIEERVLSLAAGIQGEPDSVVILTVAPEAVDGIQKLSGSDTELTEPEIRLLSEKMLRGVPSMLNGQSGVEILAASSILMADKSAVSHSELQENTAVVFFYEGGYGTYVSFIPSDDGTVLLTASCVKLPDSMNSDQISEILKLVEQTLGTSLFDSSIIEQQDIEGLLNE